MIPCPTCAFINEEGTAFCIQCGHDFTSTPNPIEPEQTEEAHEENNQSDLPVTAATDDPEGEALQAGRNDDPEGEALQAGRNDDPGNSGDELINGSDDEAVGEIAAGPDVESANASEQYTATMSGTTEAAVAQDAAALRSMEPDANEAHEVVAEPNAIAELPCGDDDGNKEEVAQKVDEAEAIVGGAEGAPLSDNAAALNSELGSRVSSVAAQKNVAPKTEEAEAKAQAATPNVDAPRGLVDNESVDESDGMANERENLGVSGDVHDARAESETGIEIGEDQSADDKERNDNPLSSLPPPPASSAVSPLQFVDSGEAAFGQRWWLKPSARQPASEDGAPKTAPIDVVDNFQTDGDDQTDPKANRPAHVPLRAAAEVDRRRFEELPTVSDTERKPIGLIIGAVLVIAAIAVAVLKGSGG
ncbi:MAG: hypothetical protein CMH52_02695 [Myxococcales bacterium]|nr:hypothetical protein [Myxococcales bacterium]|tara:strand:+ start:514 stop:1767 length:1254 start_codon:yes stop_codon:yes gene_type:complete